MLNRVWKFAALIILLIPFMQSACILAHQCNFDFEALLTKANVLSCKNKEVSLTGCSVKHRLEELSKTRLVELKSLIERTTVAVILSRQLSAEIKASWNTSLEVQTSKHLAFVTDMDCSAENEGLCARIRDSCPGWERENIFLLSAYCSERVRCAPIGSDIGLDGRPTLPSDLLSYVAFRLLERQLFIGKELGEVWLGISDSNEYSIQKDMQDAHGVRFSEQGTPVAMFVTWPLKTSAYYHIFSLFLDAALSLKKLFSFHIVDARMSRLPEKSSRPLYRYEFESHQAYLGLYSAKTCASKPNWAFDCKPIVATADVLLTSQQFSGFLLQQVLKELSDTSGGLGMLPFPSFSRKNSAISAFASLSDSYVLEVVQDESSVTDPLHDWEKLKDMATNLGGIFGLTFYPAVVTKSLAMDLLSNINSGIELSTVCKKNCFIIRMPGAGFELVDTQDSMMRMDSTAQEATAPSEWYYDSAQLSLQNIQHFHRVELPSALINCGHLFGGSDCKAGIRSVTSMEDSIGADRRIDAFVEQSKFSDVYNTTGVLVVERNQDLFDSFLLQLGMEKPWLVLFTVSWSPLCKAARAIWSAVDQCVKRIGLQDVQLVKLDCFEANDLCRYLEVDTYPTVAMFQRGRKVSSFAGKISLGKLCAFASMALAPQPVLHSQSVEETSKLFKTFVPLMSRAFVISGPVVANSVASLAIDKPFDEVIIFEQHAEVDPALTRLTAFYHESYPNSKVFEGDLANIDEVKEFITSGHTDVAFPCSWPYLTEALDHNRALAVLFYTTTASDYADLLKALGGQFIEKGSRICHFHLNHHLELNDLVQRIAGHSLPALVMLSGDKSAIHRLPLGPIAPDEWLKEASSWFAAGLNGQLTGGIPIESPKPWEPAHVVHNFVGQIYERNDTMVGKKIPIARDSRVSSRRLASVDNGKAPSADEVAPARNSFREEL